MHPFEQIITASEIETKYNLSAGTVRGWLRDNKARCQAMVEQGEIRKLDNRTWIFLTDVAERIWTNSK